jgi:serine/threonine-protein kinase
MQERTVSKGGENTQPASKNAGGEYAFPMTLLDSKASARYILECEVARGGMGVVFRAFDTHLQRRLAIKVLLQEHANDHKIRSRFLEEACIAGRLEHPGIVPIHDIGELHDGRPYFTMKLVEGKTLAELLLERNSGDLPRFLRIFEQIAQAMAYVHAQGVIHRDLKPGNIMVGAFGEVQIMDWGVAKMIGSAQEITVAVPFSRSEYDTWFRGLLETGIIGTPAYMAPEQARGEAVDERCDVFGLGGILCEILLNRPPINDCDIHSWLLFAPSELADTIRRLDASCADPQLRSLAKDCLAYEVENRPRDAAEVERRITNYRLGAERRVQELQIESATRETRETAARRFRRVGAITILLVLLLAAGTVFEFWLWRTQQHLAEQRLGVYLSEARRLSSPAATLDQLREAVIEIDKAEEVAATGKLGEAALQELERERRRVATVMAEALQDFAFLERLRTIRLNRVEDFDAKPSDRAYLKAFAEQGFDIEQAPKRLVEAIGARSPSFVSEIVAALDDWNLDLLVTKPRRGGKVPQVIPLHQANVEAVVSGLDGDESRNQLRRWLQHDSAPHMSTASKADVLQALTAAPHLLLGGLCTSALQYERRIILDRLDADLENPSMTLLLASYYERNKQTPRAIELLRRGQERHPGDLWLNFRLAILLSQTRPEESLKFFSAVRALRPEVGARMARTLRKLERYDDAERIYRDLIRRNQDSASLHSQLGRLFSTRQMHEKALSALQRAVELEPSNARFRAWLGTEYRQTGEVAKAEAEYTIALAQNETSSGALKGMGLLAEQRKDLRLAMRYFEKLTQAHPHHWEGWFLLASNAHKRSDLPQAITGYRQTLELKPDHVVANWALGNLYCCGHRWNDAEPLYRRALANDPTHLDSYDALARLLIDTGRPDEAVLLRQVALKNVPAQVVVYERLARLFEDHKQYDKATEVYRDALSRFPKDVRIRCLFGQLLESRNKVPEALAVYRSAIEANPHHAESLARLGFRLLYNNGEYAEALKLLQRAHELGPKQDPNWAFPTSEWIALCQRRMAAERMIPQLLAGHKAPSEMLLEAAAAAQTKTDFATATLLYALADAQDRHWFDTNAIRRTQAIGTAVRAFGLPQGAIADATRHECRLVALTWLHRLFDLPAAEAQRGVAKVQEMIDYKMFRPVRDEAELRKLSDEEAAAWRAFWAKAAPRLRK